MSNKDTITIYWDDKATYNRHKAALDVQNAVNLRAMAREFVKVVDSAGDELKSTRAIWEDAAVRLFVNKFESLVRSEANYSQAHQICTEKAVA